MMSSSYLSTKKAAYSKVSVKEEAFYDEYFEATPAPASPIPTPTFGNYLHFATAFHGYFNRIVQVGNERKLTADDLLPLPESYRAKNVYRDFLSSWKVESRKRATNQLWFSIYRLLFKEFWVGGAFMLVNSASVLMATMLLKWIVVAAQEEDVPMIWFYAIAILFNGLLGALSLQAFIHSAFMTGSKAVSAASSVVFSAVFSLRLHKLSPPLTVGEMTNIQSKDVAALREFLVFCHNLWACPLLVVVSVSLLVHLLGWAGLVAALALPSIIPLETYLSKVTRECRKATLKKSDERLSLIGELLDGIYTVKLTGLLPMLYDKVERLREAELLLAWRGSLLEMANSVIASSNSLVVTLVTFSAYYLIEKEALAADRAFAAIAVIGVIGRPMRVIPKTITLLSDAQVSCARIESLMLAALSCQSDIFDDVSDFEKEERRHERLEKEKVAAASPGSAPPPTVSVEGLTATRAPKVPVLLAVTLSPPLTSPGLTLVVGGNGAGKTSLLLAMMGELALEGGIVAREPKGAPFAYMGHEAWILNASARDNVLLAARGEAARDGKSCNEGDEEEGGAGGDDDDDDDDDGGKEMGWGKIDKAERQKVYDNAIRACALEVDFNDWKDGENTVIGEKGINISGGQKQRIALARAMCSSGKFFFLDSPLARLDESVAHHVFYEAILPLAKDRLVVMTTLNPGLLQYADRIIALQRGEVVFDGDYAAYLQGGAVDLLAADLKEKGLSAAFAEAAAASSSSSSSSPPPPRAAAADKKVEKKEKKSPKGGADITESSSLLQAFLFYARACKMHNLLSATGLTVLAFGMGAFGDFLLAIQADGQISMSTYLGYYTLISVLVIGANFFRYYMYSYSGLIASSDLHGKLLRSILGATFEFFNQTPSGRVTSRFSSDFETIDDSIPSSIQSLMDALLGIVTGVGVVCVEAPLYILVAIPLTMLYIFVQRKYREVSKELKKIDAGAKSPLFSNFREVVCGLETARGYQMQDLLVKKNERLIDFSIMSRINWDVANRWLGIRLDCIGALIVSAAAFSLLLNVGGSRVGGGGKAGLTISYALKACMSLSFAIRSSTALENQFTSCDRVGEYIKAPQEVTQFGDPALYDAYNSVVATSPSSGNSTKGAVVLEGRNIVARYSPSLPPALKGVSFSLKAGELVGLVGRTGSGKVRRKNVALVSFFFY